MKRTHRLFDRPVGNGDPVKFTRPTQQREGAIKQMVLYLHERAATYAGNKGAGKWQR